jgi:hypothetical protein
VRCVAGEYHRLHEACVGSRKSAHACLLLLLLSSGILQRVVHIQRSWLYDMFGRWCIQLPGCTCYALLGHLLLRSTIRSRWHLKLQRHLQHPPPCWVQLHLLLSTGCECLQSCLPALAPRAGSTGTGSCSFFNSSIAPGLAPVQCVVRCCYCCCADAVLLQPSRRHCWPLLSKMRLYQIDRPWHALKQGLHHYLTACRIAKQIVSITAGTAAQTRDLLGAYADYYVRVI